MRACNRGNPENAASLQPHVHTSHDMKPRTHSILRCRTPAGARAAGMPAGPVLAARS